MFLSCRFLPHFFDYNLAKYSVKQLSHIFLISNTTFALEAFWKLTQCAIILSEGTAWIWLLLKFLYIQPYFTHFLDVYMIMFSCFCIIKQINRQFFKNLNQPKTLSDRWYGFFSFSCYSITCTDRSAWHKVNPNLQKWNY